ncbi:MAG TPA: CYTH domain-containing protein [Candidatus Krumholzibacteria bacterium]|nr:CYTH domain-containing protein [Candidatus Krumholzibacteria bacterium]HPD72561.1 CYTH domain-containing protein [Candidatus Krumholzibacteria bacterium]HRY40507.1 CYTH domain-containing protein [Candidatus Krumholzibacteria bacterium]
MGTEIERKYLVRDGRYRDLGEGTLIRQGYLSSDPERVVRVRAMGRRAFLTVKGVAAGATRIEFEYEIPLEDGLRLLDLCGRRLIEKTRYRVAAPDGLVWEVDEFHGANEGLTVAECELATEDQRVTKPTWVGEEVTGDPRYFNSNLAARPFTTW